MIVQSQIIESTLQADGSFNVHERHTDQNGKTYNIVYNAPGDWNQEEVMAARAANLSAELERRAALAAEAMNFAIPLTHYEFMERIPQEKRIAIRAARTTNPVIEDFLDLLEKAGDVIPTHPKVQAGLAYLVSLGFLTEQEAEEIGA